jgi:hypothetical protein
MVLVGKLKKVMNTSRLTDVKQRGGSVMTESEFIIKIRASVWERLGTKRQHPQAKLHPADVVVIGLLYAKRGGYFRAFYRWLKVHYEHIFGSLPERSRLARLLSSYHQQTDAFLGEVSFFTLLDSYGIELIHPIREGRSPHQLGKKGKSNKRWIVGVKVAWLLNQQGQVVRWDWATANTHDQYFRPLAHEFDTQTITLCDQHFRKSGEPLLNLKPCRHKTWSERMLIERTFAVMSKVCAFKRMFHRRAAYLQAHLAFAAALFNLLLAWVYRDEPTASPDSALAFISTLPF